MYNIYYKTDTIIETNQKRLVRSEIDSIKWLNSPANVYTVIPYHFFVLKECERRFCMREIFSREATRRNSRSQQTNHCFRFLFVANGIFVWIMLCIWTPTNRTRCPILLFFFFGFRPIVCNWKWYQNAKRNWVANANDIANYMHNIFITPSKWYAGCMNGILMMGPSSPETKTRCASYLCVYVCVYVKWNTYVCCMPHAILLHIFRFVFCAVN